MNLQKKKIPVELRKKLREQLSSGDLKRIATSLNINVSVVYSFFSGKGERIDILKEAVEMVEMREELLNKLKNF